MQEKHEIAREAFKEWFCYGKPRTGWLFTNMNRTRAIFKLALRYCRNHIVQLKADACAANLNNKDPRKFWNSVYRMGNNKTTNHVVSVGGVSGTESITNLWNKITLRNCIFHHMNPGTKNCFKIQFLKTQTLRTGQILICMTL